jgi:hypothetical protein
MPFDTKPSPVLDYDYYMTRVWRFRSARTQYVERGGSDPEIIELFGRILARNLWLANEERVRGAGMETLRRVSLRSLFFLIHLGLWRCSVLECR